MLLGDADDPPAGQLEQRQEVGNHIDSAITVGDKRLELCLDDCRLRLNISKGSTSQGLKILRSFGAIRTVYVPGDRKDYYVAETSLRKIASGFASEQIQPHVASGKDRIERIRELLEDHNGDEKEQLEEKIDLLDNWQRRAGKTLPLVLKLIGS